MNNCPRGTEMWLFCWERSVRKLCSVKNEVQFCHEAKTDINVLRDWDNDSQRSSSACDHSFPACRHLFVSLSRHVQWGQCDTITYRAAVMLSEDLTFLTSFQLGSVTILRTLSDAQAQASKLDKSHITSHPAFQRIAYHKCVRMKQCAGSSWSTLVHILLTSKCCFLRSETVVIKATAYNTVTFVFI